MLITAISAPHNSLLNDYNTLSDGVTLGMDDIHHLLS